MPSIPDFCLPLWNQLQAGPVDVHEQEISKAQDIVKLFELGLIRVVPTQSKLLPARALVLSAQAVDNNPK